MRLAYEAHVPPGIPSATPIYDALCAEYRRLFRALPGDRSGEENLRFTGFGTVHGTGTGHWDNPHWGDRGWSLGWGAMNRPLSAQVPALPPAARDGHLYGR